MTNSAQAPLTILIITKERPHFLRMVLGYYAKAGCQFPIMISDASAPEGFEATERAIADVGRGLAVRHLAQPTAYGNRVDTSAPPGPRLTTVTGAIG